MRYKRMKEEGVRLEAEVAELLKKAEAVDEEEYQRYGKGKKGDELPKEFSLQGEPAEKDSGSQGSTGSGGHVGD